MERFNPNGFPVCDCVQHKQILLKYTQNHFHLNFFKGVKFSHAHHGKKTTQKEMLF